MLFVAALVVSAAPARAGDEYVVINASRANAAPQPAVAVTWPSAPDAEWTGPKVAAPSVVAATRAVSAPVPVMAPSPVVALSQPTAAPAEPAWEFPVARHRPAAVTAVTTTRYNRRRVDRVEATPPLVARTANPSHAEFNIVECVAGCVGERDVVVYYAPRVPTFPALTPTSASGPVAATTTVAAAVDPTLIECIAGCYDTPKRYRALPSMPPQEQAATTTSYVTTAAADAASQTAPRQMQRTKPRRSEANEWRAAAVRGSFKVMPWRKTVRRAWSAQVAVAH